MPAPRLDAIEHRRNLAGILRTALAERAGINESTFWRWDRGTSAPSETLLSKSERALDQLIREKIAFLQTLLTPEEPGNG